jgi:TonB family protein
MIGRVFVAASLLFSSAAIAESVELQPTDSWVLDYAAAECLAYREYSQAGKKLVLAIEPSPTMDSFEIAVLRDRSGPFYAEELQGSVDFGNGRVDAWLLHYGHAKQDVYRFRISAAELDQARSAPSVRLKADSSRDFTFSLSNVPALLDELAACNRDLIQYWNVDGERDGKIAVPAKGDVRSVFSANDFPQQALDRRQQGDAQFLLLIDEQGKIAGCHVLKPSGVPVFDAMGCEVIQERAKFKPAMDSAGKPLRSAVVTPLVRWRLE